MDDQTESPAADRVVELVETGSPGELPGAVEGLAGAPADERKRAVTSLRAVADDRPGAFRGCLPALAPLLTDDERPVRLGAVKLFVAVTAADPDAGVAVVDPLADRLADEEEFYYVRARAAEALGYVALEHPDAVSAPEVLADLRLGLEFDEPEVREKLAKALEYVAMGDPDRLRHRVADLAEHLDDETDLVRYHLCTALVTVGCAHPDRLPDARETLTARLRDEDDYVRGRAAEALGVIGQTETDADAGAPADALADLLASDEPFVAERVRFAAENGGDSDGEPGETTGGAPLGTLESVRATTEDAVDEMTSPDEGECPHCGLGLPEHTPPICPRCGAPR